jgi:hypothetical protein
MIQTASIAPAINQTDLIKLFSEKNEQTDIKSGVTFKPHYSQSQAKQSDKQTTKAL